MSNDSNLGSIRVLKKNFDKLNDINEGRRIGPSSVSRWKPLAARIRSYAPEFLIDKLKFVIQK